MFRFYPINIERLINGVEIKIGCKTFVFNDIDVGMLELAAYLKNPRMAIAHWKGIQPEYFEGFTDDGFERDVPQELPEQQPSCDVSDANVFGVDACSYSDRSRTRTQAVPRGHDNDSN